MNSFYQISIILTFIMFIFGLTASFVASTGAFPFAEDMGISIDDDSSFLTKFTGLTDPNMGAIFLGVTGLTFLGAVALAVLTRSVVPIGLHLFGLVFWSSWVKTSMILGYGGYIPGELLVIFTVGVMFVFIAAIVGILTGSG